MDKNNKRNNKPGNKGKVVIYQMLSFAVTIGVLALTGALLPLRPKYSESEKRKLAEFPKLTASSLSSGDFFEGINSWYSDTFPGRETVVNINSGIKNLYGIKSKSQNEIQIHGSVEKGDDIPDSYDPNAAVPEESATEPQYKQIEANGDAQTFGAIFVVGNKAFEYYNFSQSQANRYIASMNSVADKLEGKAKVYDMVVPTGIGITLPDEYMGKINSSDQGKAIDYINSGLNEKIVKLPIYNTLMSHRTEYIYFNTDHHWTQLGAYYAYCDFAKASGITANSLDKYEKVEFTDFLGTFYTDTKSPALKSNPDTITAYRPNKSATMVYTDSKGNQNKWPIVNDVSGYASSSKYSCFIAGDQPYTEITNPEITDGSSIMVVKESFGNAFVPFLVENYGTVYIVDYRHYNGSITDIVLSKNIKTVLYINNVSAIRNANLMTKLENTK